MSTKNILLECGITAEYWKYKKVESLRISLEDLYNGWGKENSIELMIELFTELKEKGYKSAKGIDLTHGYYNSIDDINLTVSKTK